MKKQFILFIFLFAGLSCSKNSTTSETRSFYMGVTPWPADFTAAELDTSYDFLNNHCDIVSHHFDDGIPWEEAFQQSVMPVKLQQEVQLRLAKTATGKKIFLSIAALNLSRKEKADYYSSSTVSTVVKDAWKQLPFDDSKMVTAYINYISWLIDQFHPLYVNYAVESNLPLWDAGSFAAYRNFLSRLYPVLKNRYPSIPFLISFMVDESTTGLSYASQLLPYTDFMGLSAYPYVTVSSSASGNTDPKNFPADYFERFISLAPQKPLAFAETGYIAEDIIIPSFGLNKQGNESWQRDYLEGICRLCQQHSARLLIWFCAKDYDAGSATLRSLGLYHDLFGFWEDTGLKSETGKQRPAYTSWLAWMAKPREE